ncbi:MAG: hypothetical protein V9F03_17260 [Microthrixaceae bacterium]
MEQKEILPKVENKSFEEKQLEFEKNKTKIELYKWLIGSVALVLITTVIDYGFRERAVGLVEIQQYDKYVTDLIVLNKEPGQKRIQQLRPQRDVGVVVERHETGRSKVCADHCGTAGRL